jgi:hypothetical protein
MSLKKRRGKRRREHHRAAAPSPQDIDREIESLDAELRGIQSQYVNRLKGTVETCLDRSGLALVEDCGSASVIFCRGREKVAYLFGDELVARGGQPRFSANFHEPGPHWAIARDFLLALQHGHQPDVGLVPLVSRDSFSQELPSDLAELGLTASARLRTRRHFAFRNSVKLTANDLVLTFEPTRFRADDVEVPFRLEQSGERAVEAALRLTDTSDPLAVAFSHDADEAAVLQAWPIALAGFADLTCLEIVPASRQRQRDRRTEQPGRDAPTVRPRVGHTVPSRRGRGAGGFGWSSRLSPVGATGELTASFVAGHRRQLHPGQHCGEEAIATARSFGIQLRPGETWVKPHERGTPSEAVVELAWRLPAALVDSRLNDSPATIIAP